VYKAFNPDKPPPCIAAIKVISLLNSTSEPTLDESSYKRIKKEIKVHSALKHYNILELIDSVEDQEGIPSRKIPPAFYIILDYAVGGDLFDQLGISPVTPSSPDQQIQVLIAHNLSI
jgi:serine/threonine-protein kinase Chk1